MQEYDQDGPMDVYSVKMTATHARKARKIGGGNFSAGVRKSIESADPDAQKKIPAEAGTVPDK